MPDRPDSMELIERVEFWRKWKIARNAAEKQP
jgi:hypothetical protein